MKNLLKFNCRSTCQNKYPVFHFLPVVPHGRGHRGAERVVAGEARVHALGRVVVGRRRGSRRGGGRGDGVAAAAAAALVRRRRRRRVVEDRAAGDRVTVLSRRHHLSVIL